MSEPTSESELPEELGRRKFLARASGILALPLVAVVGYPLVVSLVGTIYDKSKLQFTKIPGFPTRRRANPSN